MRKLFLIFWLALAIPLYPTLSPATVSVNDARVELVGNGSLTAFAYDFKVLDKTHMAVYVGGTLQTVDVNYTVGGVGAANGGTITFTTAPAAGAQVLFLRNVPMNQLSTYVANEPFPSTRIERDFDKLWMAIQQQNEAIGRSLRVPVTTGGPLSLVPDAGKCIGWNDAATLLANLNCGGSGSGSGGSAPGGADGTLQYRVSSTTLGGVSGVTTNGTGLSISSGNLTATAPIFDTTFKMTAGGTDRVVFALPSQNVVQIGGVGDSKTTALHLNPGPGTLPTDTITEFVLGRTNSQAFGGNYGRVSLTNIGSDFSNASGIYLEYGGTETPGPFIFHLGVESPAATFTNWEFLRFATTGTAEAAFTGSSLFGATDGTSRNKVVLSMPDIGGVGQRDSHALLWEGKANDGTERGVWWRQKVDVTSNAGASTFLLQRNLNGAGWSTAMSITSADVVNLPGLTASLNVCTDANKNLVSCSAGGALSGLTANKLVRATSPTAVTGSTLFGDDGTTASVGNTSTKWLAPDFTSAATGQTTVVLPAGGTAVVVAPKDCNALVAGDVIKSISATGVISCMTPSAGGTLATAGSATELQARGSANTLQAIAGTSTNGSTLTIANGVLRVDRPWITTGLLGATGTTMLSFVEVASANAGLELTNASTAAPTVAMAPYGSPTDLNLQLAAKGAGIICLGACPAGQATGVQYFGTVIVQGSTSGSISIKGQAAAGTYNFNMPTTAGTAGQVLASQGGGSTAMTWIDPAGGGTLLGLTTTYNSGILSVTNSGVQQTTTGTWTWTVAGTSGGIPYFSSASTWASSGALTANLPVIGGGAGSAPTVGTRSGNTTEFATSTGSKTTSKQLMFDASGNVVVSAYDVGTATAAGDVTMSVATGVDNVVVRTDGTGKGVQRTGVVIDDSDNVTIPGKLALGGVVNPCDGTAGCIFFGQGTAPAGLGTTGIELYAPTSVTSYKLVLPSAQASGVRFLQNDGTGVLSWSVLTGGGDALVANPLSQFAATTSAQLRGVLSDEVGVGPAVFASATTLTDGVRVNQTVNNTPIVLMYRATDTSPTGAALDLKNAAGNSSLFTVDVNGIMTVGAVPSARLTGVSGSGNACLVTSCTLVTPTLSGGGATLTLDTTAVWADYNDNTAPGVYPRGLMGRSYDATPHSVHVGGRKARGTPGSPSKVLVNDFTAAFVAEVYDGSLWPMTGFMTWVMDVTPTTGSGIAESHWLLNTGGVDALTVNAVYSSYSNISNVLGDLRIGPAGASLLSLTTNGTIRWNLNAGHLLTAADNTYDIGASGATRPRTVYAATSVITPVVTATGLITGGSFKSGAPAGGTSGTWKLGVAASVSPTSPNRTIEVDIGGTIYYIHAKTTND